MIVGAGLAEDVEALGLRDGKDVVVEDDGRRVAVAALEMGRKPDCV